MRHNVSGRKFNRTKSHKDAMLANMASSLLEHKKLYTTEAKAKELRPFVEALITKSKHALASEKQNLLPEGQKVDIHNRRMVYKVIRNKGVIQELFDAIAPVVESRNGGYCRIIKTGTRRGDAARTAIIELVDWSAPIDGAISLKRKKKVTTKKSTKQTNIKSKEKVKVGTVEEKIEPTAVDEVISTTPIVEETSAIEINTSVEEKIEPTAVDEVISTTPIVEETVMTNTSVEETKNDSSTAEDKI